MTTDTYATTGRPAWAVTMWADDQAIYVELPCIGGPPYITKYMRSEQGLGKALAVMIEAHEKANPKGARYQVAKHPMVRTAVQVDDQQRARARAILKRQGII